MKQLDWADHWIFSLSCDILLKALQNGINNIINLDNYILYSLLKMINSPRFSAICMETNGQVVGVLTLINFKWAAAKIQNKLNYTYLGGWLALGPNISIFLE